MDARPGLLTSALVFCLLGGLALSVNYPRAAGGFISDEATYYVMAHSLAEDGDLTYRREDLARVWREFSSGPTGIFLKRGNTVDLEVNGAPPFVHLRQAPDPDKTRLYFGKSFAYPLLAAPWVAALGSNGFLFFHAFLLALVVLAGYLFVHARSSAVVALLLSTSFVFASVASAYLVWTTPEVFNFAAVFLAFFCWLFREVAERQSAPRWTGWLFGPRADVAAALLLALAAFSKPPNALLFGPILFWLIYRRRWRAAFLSTAVVGALIVGLFAANVAITGDWNFQGGERRTFYTAFPYLPGGADFDVGMDRATNRVMTEVIFDPDVFWTVFLHNLGYFFVGRHSGLVPYFFPAVYALLAFAFARRGDRRLWQCLVLAVSLLEIVVLIVWIPYDYFGGGGVLGNRYFMNWYGAFFFLLPPVRSVAAAAVPWVVGAFFTAEITLNPFYSAFNPAEHAADGPFRLLPVELTLINNLPVTTNENRVRVPFGKEHPFQVYFLDSNAFQPEEGSFWVRGESTAECLVRSAPGLHRLTLTLLNGDLPNRVTVKAGGHTRSIEMEPRGVTYLSVPLDDGFPYQGTRVWTLSVTSRSGFVPMFTRGGVDFRYLGVRVMPEMHPDQP
ncbi:MAG: hypothetical protein ACE148_07700 [Vicinamibacterales bacterium]